MFLPYKISDKTVDILTSYSYEEEYKKISEAVLKQLSKEELRKVLIDGSKLQEDWFPTKNLHFDVFLSHSHGDEDKAKKLAAYLKHCYGLTTFIDSCYWNYCDDLLEQLDKQLWEPKDGFSKYNYNKRNYSTTIIHTMLSMSLMKMMSKCECFILLDSSNVHINDGYKSKTLSAWIYQEAEMIKVIDRKIPVRWLQNIVQHRGRGILETRNFCSDSVATESQSVTFDLDTSKMHLISDALLSKMNGWTKNRAMDIMHKDYIANQYNERRLLESRQETRPTRRLIPRR